MKQPEREMEEEEDVEEQDYEDTHVEEITRGASIIVLPHTNDSSTTRA